MVAALLGACSDGGSASTTGSEGSPVAPSTAPTTIVSASAVSTTTNSTTTNSTTPAAPATAVATTLSPPVYVFPFVGRDVSYGTTHHDYPAADVFGCGAIVVAPTDGMVQQTRTVDLWDPNVDSPADRGGKFVAMVGRDGVRYYFAHLDSVLVAPAQMVQPGDPLGVMGQTGNARRSACHTHLGISWPCPANEWEVRRGEVWPAPYLDAWRAGEQRSPVLQVVAAQQGDPTACDRAIADPDAADA